MKEKKVAIVYGLGSSGKSAIKFLSSLGYVLYAIDDKNEICPNATFVKNLSEINLKNIDFAVVSPGVDINNEKLHLLKENNIKLISELELGRKFIKSKIIGVTGTNGKTTCVNLIDKILKEAKVNSFKVGNVGVPITSKIACLDKKAFAVCEVSSFQMETTEKFKTFISVLINIKPDHLDRHKTMDNYISLKTKLLSQAKYKVFNADDEIAYNLSKNFKNTILFSKSKKCNGAYVEKDYIVYKNKKVLSVSDIKLLGEKNLENVLACVTVAKLCKIKNQYIRNAVLNFNALSHRIELVDIIDNVMFVDDSKSTNIASTMCAIQSFKDKDIILLLGGRDKSLDFSPIFEHKLYGVVCYGECGLNILSVAKGEHIFYEENLKNAFYKAYEIARANSVVLLSPACASFDEFENYKKRGEYFKHLVERQKKGL